SGPTKPARAEREEPSLLLLQSELESFPMVPRARRRILQNCHVSLALILVNVLVFLFFWIDVE
ncbi:hypothetical protein ISN45_Aa03g006600, partial [Arabidopsis thaliana x Arabidopsis arenosa]